MIDYKEKYEATLQTAKQWIADGCTDKEKIALETIFPELAGSEDERIRKALVWHLKADVDFVSNGVTKAECIAYLEKQNSDSVTDEDEMIRKSLIAYHTKLYEKNRNDETAPFHRDAIAYLEKRKEPEHICDSAQYEEGFKTGLEIGLRKQKEQKQAEWSEDFDTLFDKYCDQHPDGLTLEECGKFFYERGKETQEWSEADERMIERLITRLNWITYNTRTDGTSPNITFFDEIEWLKSLRPQPKWKPSEEEMNALKTAIFIIEGDRASYPYPPILVTLYEQLRKLMEE